MLTFPSRLHAGSYLIKLLDFRLARALETDPTITSAGPFVGTPTSLSPE